MEKMNGTCPHGTLYSKGRDFEGAGFRRCRGHQLDSDWCSVIFDVAGEPVQRRLQPLHTLLETKALITQTNTQNHYTRSATRSPIH